MACCGKHRTRTVQPAVAPRTITPQTPSAQYFAYFGQTGLTAVGPVTGRQYRFAHPGATLAVDQRDAPGLAGVPNLRRVHTPG